MKREVFKDTKLFNGVGVTHMPKERLCLGFNWRLSLAGSRQIEGVSIIAVTGRDFLGFRVMINT